MKQLLFRLPPRTGAIGATLGTAMNNLHSSRKKVYTHYITLLFYLNWIWRRSLKFAKFWPLGGLPLGPHGGHMYHMNTFESQAPEDDSCQVWLKSNHAFLQEVDEQLLLHRAPSPTCYPHGGHWDHPGNCHKQFLFFT